MMNFQKRLYRFIFSTTFFMFVSAFTNQSYCCNHNATDTTKLSSSTVKIVNELEMGTVLSERSIGFDGIPPNRWKSLDSIYSTATIDDLRILTSYNNVIVRCSAFHALALKKDSKVFTILLDHLLDTAQVSMENYDLGYSEMVGDYFIRIVTPGLIDTNTYKVNAVQKETLDSILLYNKRIVLSTKNFLLQNIRPDLKNYKRIRDIALKDNNAVAVLALSRYKNPKDINIINNCLNRTYGEYYAAYAVREFPDPKLYIQLVKLFNREWSKKLYDYQLWHMIYQALAKYPTKQTLTLFNKTIQTENKFRRETLGEDLLVAITKYPNPIFEHLKKIIKLPDSYRIDFDTDIKNISEN